MLSKSVLTDTTDRLFQLTHIDHDTSDTLGTPKILNKNVNVIRKYFPHIIALSGLLLTTLLVLLIVSVPLFCVKRRNGRFIIKQPLRSILLFSTPGPGPKTPPTAYTTCT